jgi:protein-disulfide isomerase
VNITRREFLLATSAVALVAAISAPIGRAWADSVPIAELMQPGPLGEQAMGAENAPVTIVEYASMTCPHCATFAVETLPKLKEKYIDKGKVRFIFREFPFDPLAAGAFMLARCAGPDKYFPVIEALFAQQAKWAVQNPIPPLLAISKQLGFTEQSFEACLKNQQVLDGIDKVRIRAAEKFNVQSTPTFFINGERLTGALPLQDFEKLIEPHLKS